ncbi:MAG: hypothetical protein KatS3mg032_0069 [Cyclobacteriaceae bacterium]|nr:MAG: hypothetical protein KatS3mg032_0069 [Cyclobacteriaceae bacterium]
MENQEQHPLRKEILTPEFLKQFKNSKDLNGFIDELFAKGMEQMLEGELDGHLGYAKRSPEGINSGNSLTENLARPSRASEGNYRLKYLAIVTAPLNLSWCPNAAGWVVWVNFPYIKSAESYFAFNLWSCVVHSA